MIFLVKYNVKYYYGLGILFEELFFVFEFLMIVVENKSS